MLEELECTMEEGATGQGNVKDQIYYEDMIATSCAANRRAREAFVSLTTTPLPPLLDCPGLLEEMNGKLRLLYNLFRRNPTILQYLRGRPVDMQRVFDILIGETGEDDGMSLAASSYEYHDSDDDSEHTGSLDAKRRKLAA